jgi:general secretion pathway protein C
MNRSLVAGLASAVVVAGLATGRGWLAEPGAELGGDAPALAPVAARSILDVASAPPAAPATVLSASAADRSRYQLEGVMADTAAEGAGLALIAVDGALARPFGVGEAVIADLVLLGVSPGGAILGRPNGTPILVLDVAARAGVLAATAGASPSGKPLPSASPAADGPLTMPVSDLGPVRPEVAQPSAGRQASGRHPRLQRPDP